MTGRRAIVGVVLAGGASRRMGGVAKATLRLGDETLVARAVERLRPQVDAVVVNANDPGCEVDGVPLVADAFSDRRGPLAGVLAAMDWCAVNRTDADAVVSVAVDTPFFPSDLVERLARSAPPGSIAVAEAGGRAQPTFGLWPTVLRDALRAFLTTDGSRKILDFVHGEMTRSASTGAPALVKFDATSFDNVNTPDELAAARRRIA